MRKAISFKEEYAVSEVIGALILVLIAVVTFTAILSYVFPLPLPDAEANTKLMGFVDDQGYIVVEHIGGEPLLNYKITVGEVGGSIIDTTTYEDTSWSIGERVTPTINVPLIEEDDELQITVYTTLVDGIERRVFDGILTGKGVEPSNLPIILISSLRTNTIDEDLICFNNTIIPEIDASTYIYKWIVDGEPLNEMLLPFDTQNNVICKDYSGNGYNGTIIDASWVPNGKVGGAYDFSGGGDYITFDLPDVFNDISRNHFTISLWLKSDDISTPHKVVLESGENIKNFIKITQYQSQINFGVFVDKGKVIECTLTTDNLSSNTWYHIVGTWDPGSEEIGLYLDGEVVGISTGGGRGIFSYSSEEGEFNVGRGGGYWDGLIDELQVFSHVLSEEQIYQLYQSMKGGYSDKSVIVSEETNVGEVWQCVVTPNDGTQDGVEVESNTLKIVNYDGGE